MAARGLTDKEIAARLGARSHTVSNYVSIVLLKLGARNRTEAVAQAFRRGILHIDDREDSSGKAPRGMIPLSDFNAERTIPPC